MGKFWITLMICLALWAALLCMLPREEPPQILPGETSFSTQEPTLPVPETEPPETVPTLPPHVHPEPLADYALTARNAFVYHCGKEELLFSKGDMEGQVYPASLTKLLVA